jgi:negative regulator of flagellin synthesis FlgM
MLLPVVTDDTRTLLVIGGDEKMQINGPAHLHAAQSVNPPHHSSRASKPAGAQVSSLAQLDQLDISQEANLVSRVRDLPEIRQDRVAEIRAQIASGTYETDAKLNGALDRLLDEIG